MISPINHRKQWYLHQSVNTKIVAFMSIKYRNKSEVYWTGFMILGVENGSYNIGHITRRSFTPQTFCFFILTCLTLSSTCLIHGQIGKNTKLWGRNWGRDRLITKTLARKGREDQKRLLRFSNGLKHGIEGSRSNGMRLTNWGVLYWSKSSLLISWDQCEIEGERGLV